MIGLIGAGLIGTHLSTFINADMTFTSDNISDMLEYQFDVVYCAAPSGNRIQATNNPDLDLKSVNRLIAVLEKTKIDKIILISTGDTQIKPNSVYGRNRLILEQFIKTFNNYHIIRLSALIDNKITKNILYDIKHEIYLDKINANTKLQWYPLDNLEKDLSRIVGYNIKETNLCSEPILVREMIDTVAPHLLDKIVEYPAGTHYNLNPYSHTKEDIFKRMREYLA